MNTENADNLDRIEEIKKTLIWLDNRIKKNLSIEYLKDTFSYLTEYQKQLKSELHDLQTELMP